MAVGGNLSTSTAERSAKTLRMMSDYRIFKGSGQRTSLADEKFAV